jgi:hypothetical protein
MRMKDPESLPVTGQGPVRTELLNQGLKYVNAAALARRASRGFLKLYSVSGDL